MARRNILHRRNAGFRNRIMSLKDGTMAWHLAGFEVVKGATRRQPEVSEAGRQAALEAASRVVERCVIRRIDKATLAAWRGEAGKRTLYVLDVRTPEEYLAGHLVGARSAPGGQLVQETDAHIATLNARVVLVDDNGVRATMTASWLKHMGWYDVAVLADDGSDGELSVTDFCLICAPRIATMSPKSSLPQLAKSVSVALIPDSLPGPQEDPTAQRQDPQRRLSHSSQE
jgi:rhodanese-related sulfurtransferase